MLYKSRNERNNKTKLLFGSNGTQKHECLVVMLVANSEAQKLEGFPAMYNTLNITFNKILHYIKRVFYHELYFISCMVCILYIAVKKYF